MQRVGSATPRVLRCPPKPFKPVTAFRSDGVIVWVHLVLDRDSEQVVNQPLNCPYIASVAFEETFTVFDDGLVIHLSVQPREIDRVAATLKDLIHTFTLSFVGRAPPAVLLTQSRQALSQRVLRHLGEIQRRIQGCQQMGFQRVE